MPIYTKTGDKGETSLFSGKRVPKSNIRVETYGSIDELNSLLGVVRSFLPTDFSQEVKRLDNQLEDIQHTLFYCGSYLADLPDALNDINLEDKTKLLEQEIDTMTKKLPALNNFIIPSGGHAGSLLQLARAVSRRAERQLVRLNQEEKVDVSVVKYINRLSDVLFTMARYINHIEKKKETIWQR